LSGKPGFKAWNIACNLLGGYAFGHCLWETRLLAEALARRGTEARVFGHTSIRAEDYPAARIFPAFALHYTTKVSQDSEWGDLENFVVHNLAYEKSLGKIDHALLRDSLMLFPDIGEWQLLGALRWLERLDEAARPHTALILQGQLDWSAASHTIEMHRKIWAGRPDAVKRRVRLCVRSEMSVRRYEQLLGVRPHILPSALGPTESEVRAARERVGSSSGALTVSFLAGSRLERGAMLTPDVVTQCESLGVQFLVQLTDPVDMTPEQVVSLRALKNRPGVRLHEGMLSRDDYNDWIAQSVVLLPYDAARYQSRTSGVYLEAKCFGAPVIVAAGSWMADEVARLGNGLVFEEYSPTAIARCIARAQAELGTLRERAAACAADYRRLHGADRCVDTLESLLV
jgi:hypothetical protein